MAQMTELEIFGLTVSVVMDLSTIAISFAIVIFAAAAIEQLLKI